MVIGQFYFDDGQNRRLLEELWKIVVGAIRVSSVLHCVHDKVEH